jgi:hypothetical protein
MLKNLHFKPSYHDACDSGTTSVTATRSQDLSLDIQVVKAARTLFHGLYQSLSFAVLSERAYCCSMHSANLNMGRCVTISTVQVILFLMVRGASGDFMTFTGKNKSLRSSFMGQKAL